MAGAAGRADTVVTRSSRIARWPIVGWAAIVIAALVVLTLAAYGTGEEGVRAVIRLTARTSLPLFLAAFSASALNRQWPTPTTRWLLTNRRYLGVSFAVSHFTHLAAILILLKVADDFQIETTTLIFGGGAYVFIAAMAATSFDRTAAWLGPRAWRRLHVIGMYYIWTIFFISYFPRALQSAPYVPLALVLILALTLRIVARRPKR